MNKQKATCIKPPLPRDTSTSSTTLPMTAPAQQLELPVFFSALATTATVKLESHLAP